MVRLLGLPYSTRRAGQRTELLAQLGYFFVGSADRDQRGLIAIRVVTQWRFSTRACDIAAPVTVRRRDVSRLALSTALRDRPPLLICAQLPKSHCAMRAGPAWNATLRRLSP